MPQTLKEKIIDVVKASTSIDKKAISESTATKGIVLEGALSKLIKDKILVVEVKDGEKIYSISPETEVSSTAEASVPQISPRKRRKRKEDVEITGAGENTEKSKTSYGKNEGKRDMRKFRFKGEHHTKGGLVHAVITEFVSKRKNISLAKLKESFPDELLQRFGVVQEISKAKQFASGGRDRFFMQPEKVIKLNEKKIVVCNQFTAENIKPFLTAARKLGFDIR
ncbi:MAG: hypothetical protein IPJ66_11675 [Bacteroidetes bacterium]|nr:hypothetical protein [Bacteroidota bacterium]